MKSDTIFPQKLALGSNFCNRINEQRLLKNLILENRPALITSPRRYGKTSLAVYVLKNLNIPYSHLDLFPLADIQDVENAILGGVGEIVGSTENTTEKALRAISSFFSELSISFKLIGTKITVDLGRSKSELQTTTISNALKVLDEKLTIKKQKAVLFLDEFQRLGQMNRAEIVEGAIRHVAQQSHNLIFVFSGSNRHLLGEMFDSSNRPLYKLCNRIVLERISKDDYQKFLIKFSNDFYSENLPEATIDCILDLTERHPYYVNVLCSRLWRSEKIFSQEDVKSCWNNYAVEEKSAIFKELELLSLNQMKLLIAISMRNAVLMPLSDDFLTFARLPVASARQSLKALVEKDYVHQNEHKEYCVLDPLIKYILSERPI